MIVINWWESYGNTPSIAIEGEPELYLRDRAECEFREVAPGLWMHEQANGLVQYFAHDGTERNNGGFGGAVFRVLVDGRVRDFIGPWSSRASCFNKYLDRPIVDIRLNNRSCGITLDALLERWDLPYFLVQEQPRPTDAWFDGEPGAITVSTASDKIRKPSGDVCHSTMPFNCLYWPKGSDL